MQRPIHPLHAALLAGTVPLFLGVLLNDIAYSVTYEIQWKNFASWLIVGGLLFGGFALLWAAIDFFRTNLRTPARALYPLVLLATWILGFINALVHAGDAWASIPTGSVLATITTLLAMIATGLGLHRSHASAAP